MADELGLIQVYTGDGKGKSTAAFGLALRASGCGLKVVIIQFMKKGGWYGETATLQLLPNLELYCYGTDRFAKKGSPDEENIAQAQAALAKSREVMAAGAADLLILDELNNAIFFELVTEAQVKELLAAKPQSMELVVTGRNAPDYLIEAADLVSEMREVKHPYQKGVQARQGIEY